MTLADRLARQSARLQQVTALGVLTLLLLTIWWAVIEPTRWILTSQSQWRARTSRTLAQDRGWAAAAAQIQAGQKALDESPWWGELYPHASNEEDLARLRRDVSAVAAAAGGHVDQIESHGGKPRDRLTELSIRLVSTLTIEQLKALLVQIKTHHPYLRADRLHVTAPQSQSKDSNASLSVTLDLTAYSIQRVTPPGEKP